MDIACYIKTRDMDS